MTSSLMRSIALLAALLSLCQCGAPEPPTCSRVPLLSRTPADRLITDARQAWSTLEKSSSGPEKSAALLKYNRSIAALFDQLRCGPGSWNDRASNLGTRIHTTDRTLADPESFDAIFPADDVSTGIVGERRTTPGLGLSLVGWKKTTPITVPRPPFYPPTGIPYSLTAVLDFDSPQPTWKLSKRWIVEETTVGKQRQTLDADWSAAIAFYWQMSLLDDLTIQNVLLPERYMEETGLYFLQPYDPDKIPVVMVHGLKSSPDAFKRLINDLSPQPWFRENYQIWLFNYPTGNPWLYTGIHFRKYMEAAAKLARSKGHDRNLNRMVVLCHSMGGLITRSSVTDPGNKLYDAHFEARFEDLQVAPQTRTLIQEGLLYEPLDEPSRVVFMAVPHRGSPMANLRATMLIQNFIKLPKRLTVDLLDAALHSGSGDANRDLDKVSRKAPNSVSSLSPESRGIVGLKKLPLPKDITFHSIIGDRGRGTLLQQSSDGVVPYWSSHLHGVASEKIVPKNHGVPDCPEASKEVQRILKLHLTE